MPCSQIRVSSNSDQWSYFAAGIRLCKEAILERDETGIRGGKC